jgi:RNA polymerase sigma-70 factor (ECF subfamily)
MDNNEFARRVLEAEPTLYRISKAILKNDADCADAVQEAIIRAFAKLGALRDEAFFKTWLCRILINECNRVYRYNKRAVPYGQYLEPARTEQAENTEGAGLYAALARLDEKRRLAVVLHYVEGFRTAEIARMLTIPEGTVKSRLSKARAELKGLLNE